MDIRKLAIQTDDMTDATRLGMFLDNLKPELSAHCYLNEVKTLDQAYDLALLKETYGKEKKTEPYIPAIYYSYRPIESTKPTQSSSLPLQEKKSNNYNNNNNNRSNNVKQEAQLPLKQAKPKNQHLSGSCASCFTLFDFFMIWAP
jgi:hypothetical protein